MAKVAYNLLYQDLGPLARFVPCSCHNDPYAVPTYNVKISSSTMHRGSSPLIKAVKIECSYGHSNYADNLEGYGIYEDDLYF